MTSEQRGAPRWRVSSRHSSDRRHSHAAPTDGTVRLVIVDTREEGGPTDLALRWKRRPVHDAETQSVFCQVQKQDQAAHGTLEVQHARSTRLRGSRH